MTGVFLLEIGTEEIPARFVTRALTGLESLMAKKCMEHRLSYKRIRVMGTPRRLTCIIDDLPLKQEGEIREVFGPPKQAAIDAAGNFTNAAQGFARAHGADVSQLIVEKTSKREVVCIRKEIQGCETLDLLKEFVPSVITSIPFPKSMRWGTSSISFARPIHWILTMLNGEVVPFELNGVLSSSHTRGHRFMAPQELVITDGADYFEKLRQAYVIIDPRERKEQLIKEITHAATQAGGVILSDNELIEENTYLTEYPTAVCGSFDTKYLELPPQVLITAMREHQRYFAVVNSKGTLLPHFVAVNNTLARDPNVVRAGHERVLRARLEDANFFYDEDRKIPLAEHAQKLKGVLFQAKLGTSYQKVERFRDLVAFITGKINPKLMDNTLRCAYLSKADLVTEMVGEFPSLQGVMGKVYALASGEKEDVATGIEEHYLPRFSGDELPKGDLGALVGMADRMDTIVGCFSIGLIPSGAADPYALRRHTLAIIHILLERQYDLDLSEFISESLRLLKDRIERPENEVLKEVLEFFRIRLRGMFGERGFSHDVIDAVLSLHMNHVHDAVKRVEALEYWRKQPDFGTHATSFKRVFNIIKDQICDGPVDSGIFQTIEEAQLFGAYQTVGEDVEFAITRRDYSTVLSLLFTLKEGIDNFFDSVMVMDQDHQVRANRLNLLAKVAGLFKSFADFSKLEV